LSLAAGSRSKRSRFQGGFPYTGYARDPGMDRAVGESNPLRGLSWHPGRARILPGLFPRPTKPGDFLFLATIFWAATDVATCTPYFPCCYRVTDRSAKGSNLQLDRSAADGVCGSAASVEVASSIVLRDGAGR